MKNPFAPHALALLLLLSGCDPTTAPQVEQRRPDVPSPATTSVSEPVAHAPDSDSNAALRASVAVAYVAYAPGELGDAQSVKVTNVSARITDPDEHAVINGGLDPVPVLAAIGDTLELRLTAANGSVSHLRARVPARRPPRVIRINPTKGRTDVAVNSTVTVIFSEPIDVLSITPSSLRLLRGSDTVPGRFIFESPLSLSVQFVPAQPLEPSTSYALVLDRGIRDANGDSLPETTESTFRTTENEDAPVASVTVSAPLTILNVGSNVWFTATVRDSAGRALSGAPVTWASSNVSVARVSAVGAISAIGIGSAIISASAGTHTGQVTVTVTDATSAVRINTTSSGDEMPSEYSLYGLLPATSSDAFPRAVIPANGMVVLEVPAGGPRDLYLAGVPGHCNAEIPARTPGLTSGDTLSLDITVTCAARGPTQMPTTQALAFVRGEDVHAANLDGSNEVRLTSTGTNRSPAWSPDGTQLAYSSDRSGERAIHLLNAAGTTRLATSAPAVTAEAPAWAPTGDRIAFTGNFDSSIAIGVLSVSDTGTNAVALTDRAAGFVYSTDPSWSQDGSRIAFVSDWVAYDFVYDIYVMDADGSNVERLTEGFASWPSVKYNLHPAWSPDGTRIAFVRGTVINESDMRFTVSIMARDGTGRRDLAWAGDIAWMEPLDPGSLAWSPDGSRIAFTFVECDLSGAVGASCSKRRSIRYVSVDGQEQGALVNDAHSPAWRR